MADRKINLSLILVVSATLVATPRYMEVAGSTVGITLAGDWWSLLNVVCGAFMAVLEGISVWYCWKAWSSTRPSTERIVLLLLIGVTILSLFGSIMPTIIAGASHQAFINVVGAGWILIWASCVTVAPFAIMASNAIAGTLKAVDTISMETLTVTRQVDTAAPVSQLPQPAQIPVDQPRIMVQPTLEDLLADNPGITQTEIARRMGITVQAVNKRIMKMREQGRLKV